MKTIFNSNPAVLTTDFADNTDGNWVAPASRGSFSAARRKLLPGNCPRWSSRFSVRGHKLKLGLQPARGTRALPILLLLAVVLSTFTASAQMPPPPPPGANYSQGGFGGNTYAINPGGSGSFSIYTGNLHREVKDLEVWGGAGEHPLVFSRHFNSRMSSAGKHFGSSNWRHSYQWEMAANGNDLDVFYPDGTRNKFTDVGGSQWTSTAAVPDVLWQTNNIYTLRTPKGWQYEFAKLTNAGTIYYQMQKFTDSRTNQYTFTYDSDNRVTRVTEPAGRYLDFTFATNRISQVQASDGRTATYTYAQVLPNFPTMYVLSTVGYGDGTQAEYTTDCADVTVRLLTAKDPRLPGPRCNVTYTYSYGMSGYFISKETDTISGTVLTSISYDYSGNASVTNGVGQRMLATYTSGGMTKTLGDPLSRTNSFGYDASGAGYLTTVTNALGQVTWFTNSTRGNRLAVLHANGAVERWTRDDFDNLLSYTNALGHPTVYVRDFAHRVTRIDYADGTREGFAYTNFDNILRHTNRNGGIAHCTYSTNGLRLTATDPLGNLTSFTYDTNDRLASVTDPRTNTTSYLYTERGLVKKITLPDSAWRGFGYDTYGNKTSETNELGQVSTYGYNALRLMTNSTDPLGRVTLCYYDAERRLTQVTSPGGITNRFEYDAAGQRIREIMAHGTADVATNTFQYDAAGRETNRVDGLGRSWATTYDSVGRRLAAIDPLGNTTQWTYDLAGNRLTERRPDGGTNRFTYDSMSRVLTSTDPLNQVTTYTYDAAGNVLTLTDARNNTYTTTYDAQGRKTKLTYPGGSSEGFGYDAVGNQTTYTNRAGSVRTATFDSLNRETGRSWNDGVTPATTRTFDSAGRLLTLTNSASQLAYTYDSAGQVLSEVQNLSTISARTNSYTYDSDGRRLRHTYPAGNVITNTYTARGQVAAIYADGSPALATFCYNATGQRATNTLENGASVEYAYDNACRMTTVNHRLSGTSFASFDYGYNAVGNRTSRVESGTGLQPVTDAYTYDATDQVASVNYNAGTRTVSYQWDAVGNRQSVTNNGTGTSYTANALNQYTAIGGDSPTYDNRGNLATQNGWTYTFDAQNRLLTATNNTTTSSFSYDARNRCVSRTINGTTTLLIYDGWSLIEEWTTGGAQIAHYVHGPRIDEILLRVSTTNAIYYHYDALGNVTHLTATNGAVVERYTYDVFGKPTILDANSQLLSASSFANRFLFTGREWLAEITLYDYRNRIYSPDLGRFLQTDPIRFAAGDVNIYRYVENGAINSSDPSGLVLGDPSDHGFTIHDIYMTAIMADAAGIAGYNGVTFTAMLHYIQTNQNSASWGDIDPADNPTGNPSTGYNPLTENCEIHFPIMNWNIQFPNIPPDDPGQGLGYRRYSFESAVMHELMHVYAFWTSNGDRGDHREMWRATDLIEAHVRTLPRDRNSP